MVVADDEVEPERAGMARGFVGGDAAVEGDDERRAARLRSVEAGAKAVAVLEAVGDKNVASTPIRRRKPVMSAVAVVPSTS